MIGGVHTKETKNLKKPLGGIIIGIAFLLLGTAWIVCTESAFQKFLGSILIIATLVHTAYYSAILIKRSRHKNTSRKITLTSLVVLLTLSMMAVMPQRVYAYWEAPLPSEDTPVNQTLVTYNHETHGEVALSANLYEINKDYPQLGQYEFAIAVVAAANSRYKMGYSVKYRSIELFYEPSNTLTLGDNEGAWVDIGWKFLYYGG